MSKKQPKSNDRRYEKIVELLEKNLNGKLSTGDMVEAEKQLEHWKRELDSMIEIVKKILVEV